MRSARNVSTISQLKSEKRSNTELPRFGFTPEVSADTSSCCFRSNDTTGNVSDHQTFLSLIWQNLPYHRLGWLELNTLFSKDIFVNMFSRIPCRMATVNGDENAVPTNLESSSSESNTKTPKKGQLHFPWYCSSKNSKIKEASAETSGFKQKRRDSVLDRLTISRSHIVAQTERLTWNLTFYSVSERQLRRRLAKRGL